MVVGFAAMVVGTVACVCLFECSDVCSINLKMQEHFQEEQVSAFSGDCSCTKIKQEQKYLIKLRNVTRTGVTLLFRSHDIETSKRIENQFSISSSPLDLAVGWQFFCQTALHPRAPSQTS